MALKAPNQKWLDLVREPIIDPDRLIVDPHHHLWESPGWTYVLDDLWSDTGSGHHITKTVYLECRSSYYEDGPEHLKPVGETEFVESFASASREGSGSEIAGIVGHADLCGSHLDEVLDAHEKAAKGLFRGIRHSIARDQNPEALALPGRGAEGLSKNEAFRQGVRQLGERGYTYESWLYHHQVKDYKDLAEAAPNTTIILDHFGTPLVSVPTQIVGKKFLNNGVKTLQPWPNARMSTPSWADSLCPTMALAGRNSIFHLAPISLSRLKLVTTTIP